MSLYDLFRRKPTVPIEQYNSAMSRVAELIDDKKRLQAQVDDLAGELKNMRESYAKLAREKKPEPVTTEAIARRLGIPETLIGQIDWDAMGVQVPKERH